MSGTARHFMWRSFYLPITERLFVLCYWENDNIFKGTCTLLGFNWIIWLVRKAEIDLVSQSSWPVTSQPLFWGFLSIWATVFTLTNISDEGTVNSIFSEDGGCQHQMFYIHQNCYFFRIAGRMKYFTKII